LKVFKLEQNYRSTQNIVNVANSIIRNNKDQLKKNVFSEKESGDKIKVMRAFSDNEEGKIVAEAIMQDAAQTGLNGRHLLYFTVPMRNPALWRRPYASWAFHIKYMAAFHFISVRKLKT
jgi:hypothetical protein